MKKKFIDFCKQGDSAITERHFSLIPQLKGFLVSKYMYLTPEEKSALEIYLTKMFFLSTMIKKGEPILH